MHRFTGSDWIARCLCIVVNVGKRLPPLWMGCVEIASGTFIAFVRSVAILSRFVELSSFMMITIVLIVSRIMMKFTKIIPGYVTQHFEGSTCTSQNFVADNTPEYEVDGRPVLGGCPVHPEAYHPVDLVQPGADCDE